MTAWRYYRSKVPAVQNNQRNAPDPELGLEEETPLRDQLTGPTKTKVIVDPSLLDVLILQEAEKESSTR